MGTRLVKDFSNRKWVDVFINSSKKPKSEENSVFSDIDMFLTILSLINFDIEGNKLGFGTDLFSAEKTLIESLALDQLNFKLGKMASYLIHESYLLKKEENAKK